jgi:hypothetical protein
MDDERDTGSDGIAYPTGNAIGLEFGKFQLPKCIRLMGRRHRIVYRCCHLGRAVITKLSNADRK